jgi:hypothetical protein
MGEGCSGTTARDRERFAGHRCRSQPEA